MQITQVIKYEGDNSTFIWKHPCEDFNTTTQLIVHESQEAIFFINGQITAVSPIQARMLSMFCFADLILTMHSKTEAEVTV